MSWDSDCVSFDEKITDYMGGVLMNYESIRGVHKKESNFTFWDAVVISASDEQQKIAYEIQIHEKGRRLEIPLDIPFHVFADPPGHKIGCGGSTMYVLSELHKIYGCKLLKMRILSIPAGGQSQRLPSLSALGKLFCPLPLGNPPYQMLDLVLAVYLPFLENMTSGVFLVSSDAIISYHIDRFDHWTFMNDGFTALAHPSSIQTGTQHGVYVLTHEEQHSEMASCFMSRCSRVLQKPTEKMLYESGAVFTNYHIPGGDALENIVFSDSAFFFSSTIVQQLVQLYEQIKPVNCEISSYGDFLQPLGIDATSDYIFNKSSASNVNSELVHVRRKIYELLHGSPLHILILKHSSFHHLGTMSEYTENLCEASKLKLHFFMSRISNSVLINKIPSALGNVKGTLINSVVNSSSCIPETTLLEYCNFTVPLDVGEHCILSNCSVEEHDTSTVKIPSQILLHTIAIDDGYATVAFSITDDIKKCYEKDDILSLKYLGRTLKDFYLHCFGNNELFDVSEYYFSLWSAKLFPICSTRSESFLKTVSLISCIRDNILLPVSDFKAFTSIKSILEHKNVKSMLNYQYSFVCNAKTV